MNVKIFSITKATQLLFRYSNVPNDFLNFWFDEESFCVWKKKVLDCGRPSNFRVHKIWGKKGFFFVIFSNLKSLIIRPCHFVHHFPCWLQLRWIYLKKLQSFATSASPSAVTDQPTDITEPKRRGNSVLLVEEIKYFLMENFSLGKLCLRPGKKREEKNSPSFFSTFVDVLSNKVVNVKEGRREEKKKVSWLRNKNRKWKSRIWELFEFFPQMFSLSIADAEGSSTKVEEEKMELYFSFNFSPLIPSCESFSPFILLNPLPKIYRCFFSCVSRQWENWTKFRNFSLESFLPYFSGKKWALYESSSTTSLSQRENTNNNSMNCVTSCCCWLMKA